jgi:hypothetical protein
MIEHPIYDYEKIVIPNRLYTARAYRGVRSAAIRDRSSNANVEHAQGRLPTTL